MNVLLNSLVWVQQGWTAATHSYKRNGRTTRTATSTVHQQIFFFAIDRHTLIKTLSRAVKQMPVFCIVVEDMKTLCISLWIENITKALECALGSIHSAFNTKVRKIIVDLNKIWFISVVTQYYNQLYLQKWNYKR